MDIESVKLFIFEALDICHNHSCFTCPIKFLEITL